MQGQRQARKERKKEKRGNEKNEWRKEKWREDGCPGGVCVRGTAETPTGTADLASGCSGSCRNRTRSTSRRRRGGCSNLALTQGREHRCRARSAPSRSPSQRAATSVHAPSAHRELSPVQFGQKIEGTVHVSDVSGKQGVSGLARFTVQTNEVSTSSSATTVQAHTWNLAPECAKSTDNSSLQHDMMRLRPAGVFSAHTDAQR